jgi:hypothetical protein
MTPEMLISEGQRLVRPCVLLRPSGDGPVAAIWHERDNAEIANTGCHCWITLDARFVPDLSAVDGFLSVFTDEKKCQGGRVEFYPAAPNRPGTALYASEELVLPPIDAVFARGSDAVGAWLAANDWPRNERYNSNFPDSRIVKEYEREWFKAYPIYRRDDTYAVLGGWHFPCADDDWYELIDEQLMVLPVRDSEPWVEAWRLRNEQFKVIQRIS